MTTVFVARDQHGVCKLQVSGHSGYAASGRDIVCAAASVLITTCANALESVAAISPLVSVNEARAEFAVALPRSLPAQNEHDARVILSATLQGFSDLAVQYPKFIQINDGRTSSC
ncbi:MAG: ribosomal-processing cysteine protease Prp [Clostridia bacterium]